MRAQGSARCRAQKALSGFDYALSSLGRSMTDTLKDTSANDYGFVAGGPWEVFSFWEPGEF
jgi:hypothetical protein